MPNHLFFPLISLSVILTLVLRDVSCTPVIVSSTAHLQHPALQRDRIPNMTIKDKLIFHCGGREKMDNAFFKISNSASARVARLRAFVNSS